MNISEIEKITSIPVAEKQIEAAKQRIDELKKSANLEKQRVALTNLRSRLLDLFDKKYPSLREIR